MAINPEDEYPGKITPSSVEFPFGKARNITTPNDGKGTPWEAALVNDLFGWQQALLSAVGKVPSGTPDEVGASQYLDSMRELHGSLIDDAGDFATATLAAGLKITTQGFGAPGDGGELDYIIKTAAQIGGEIIDGLRNVATADTNVAQATKPAYVVQNGGTGFAPNEFKYLFMNPLAYAAGNLGANPIEGGNQFHYFGTGPDIRCEFEADIGKMQLYIESGEAGGFHQEVWYGWQHGPEHLWSFGTNGGAAVSKNLKLVKEFGINDTKNAYLEVSHANGQITINQDGVGVAPLRVSTNTGIVGAAGLLVECGEAADALYLASFRTADGTERIKLTPLGRVQAQLGSEASPIFSFIDDNDTGMFSPAANNLGFVCNGIEQLRIGSTGRLLMNNLGSPTSPVLSWLSDPDTGIFNPGINAVAIATGGVERTRVNSLGNFLINNTSGGDGEGIIDMGNANVVPTVNNTNGGTIYIEAGALKYRGSGGTVTTLGNA